MSEIVTLVPRSAFVSDAAEAAAQAQAAIHRDRNAKIHLAMEEPVRDAAMMAETVRDLLMHAESGAEHVEWAINQLVDMTAALLPLYRQADEDEEGEA